MSDVRINTRSPYYIEANPTEPTVPETPEIPDPPANTPPTVTITASNENPYEGETVTLTAVATDSDGTIVSYLWGGTSSPQTTVSIDVTSSIVESKIFNVAVTDDDGDVAIAQITINWQEIPQPTTNTDISVACGDTFNQANFNGIINYNLLVGDKIGDVTITFLDTVYSPNDVPIKFTLEWDGNTATTGYIGDSDYNESLSIEGVDASDINTSYPTNKASGTTLTISKTAAAPNQVTLKAQNVLPTHDSYTFRLDCPDVLATQTFYHTLTGTCTSGDTTFTYTDVNGDTQTVILANGETQLVSAQEDTVVTAVCSGIVDKGGESFDLGKPEQELNKFVEINIVLDDSGSMNSTLTPLFSTLEGSLKDKLISSYGDVAEYNKRVRVIKSSELYRETVGFPVQFNSQKEAFLKILNGLQSVNSDTSQIITLYFIDEVNSRYTSTTSDSYDTSNVNFYSDLAGYRSFLDTLTYGEQFTTMFIVDSPDTTRTWWTSLFDGSNGFYGSRGLSDRSEITNVMDVRNAVDYNNEPNYYSDLIIEALQSYGFNI